MKVVHEIPREGEFVAIWTYNHLNWHGNYRWVGGILQEKVYDHNLGRRVWKNGDSLAVYAWTKDRNNPKFVIQETIRNYIVEVTNTVTERFQVKATDEDEAKDIAFNCDGNPENLSSDCVLMGGREKKHYRNF